MRAKVAGSAVPAIQALMCSATACGIFQWVDLDDPVGEELLLHDTSHL